MDSNQGTFSVKISLLYPRHSKYTGTVLKFIDFFVNDNFTLVNSKLKSFF